MNTTYSCVLIVDDDETSIFLSERIIERNRFAYEIHSSYNGEDALIFLKDHCNELHSSVVSCPEVIFLDINMPIMDGFEFMKEFNASTFYPNSKVIILTSSNNPRDLEMAKELGITGYINKPLTDDKIRQIHELLIN
jgi:CheY-like chemotaxis protein